MDDQGVDIHALSLTQPMVYWAPPDLALRLSEAYNDSCVEAHLAYPGPFPRSGDAADAGTRGPLAGNSRGSPVLPEYGGSTWAPKSRIGSCPTRASFPSTRPSRRRVSPSFCIRSGSWIPGVFEKFYLTNLIGESDRVRDCRIPSHFWSGARPFSGADVLPSPCRRHVSLSDRAHYAWLGRSPRMPASAFLAGFVSPPLLLRHHHAFPSGARLPDIVGRSGQGAAGQRFLFRHVL